MAGVRQFDESKTLDKALTLFWKKGYSATSMLDLAESTGVQRGSLYNAYRSKERLFTLAFDRYKRCVLAEARQALEPADVREALRSFFEWTIQSMTRGVPSRGCLTTKTAMEEDKDSPEIQDAVRGMLDDLEAVLRERFARDDAAARLALPPADAARVIITYTRGIVVVERVYRDAARLRRAAALLIDMLAGPATAAPATSKATRPAPAKRRAA
jgi:AcrR family transcriptional regulator